MEITRGQKEVSFSFEEREWKIDKGAAVRAFLEEMKAVIPKGNFHYRSEIKTWFIECSWFDSVIPDLRKKHFEDERQESLF
jgi:hypothetical protein